MNKFMTKVVGICLGLTMAVGVGVAVASSREAVPVHAANGVTATYTVQSTTSATKTAGTAPDGSSVTYSQTYGTAKQITKNNSITLTLSGYDGCTITGLSVSVHSNSKAGTGSLSFKSGDSTIGSIASNQFSNAAWYGSWSSDYVDVSVTCTSTEVGDGEDLVLTIAATVNSLFFESATITYNEAVTTTPNFTLDKNEVALTLGGSSTTVTATPNEYVSGSAEYSWSRTAGDDCVTLTNANTATVTIAPKGTAVYASCTLTIAVTGCTSKTVSVSVKKVSSSESPFTVAEAKTVIDDGESADSSGVYVHGIISQVDSYQSNTITYWISDDGTTTDQFEVYKGKNVNNTNFTAIGDLAVGYEVTVYGNITLYNSSVYEFSSGNYLTSLVRPNTFNVSVSTDAITLSDDEVGTTGSVTLTTAGGKKGSITSVSNVDSYELNDNILSLTGVSDDVVITASVIDADIVSIALSGQKTKFALTDDFEFNGTVTGTYDDWCTPHTTEILASGFTVNSSAFKKGVEGTYTITITYGGSVSASYSVRVVDVFDSSKGEYHLATTSDIVEGAHIVIASGATDVVLNRQSGNNCPQGEGAKYVENSNNLVTKTNALDLELVEGVSEGTFALKCDDDCYLAATGASSNNYLTTLSSIENRSSFTFTRVSDTDWTIEANITGTRRFVRYNSGSSIFSCYASGGQAAITVYAFEKFTDEAKSYAETFIKGSENAGTCAATISSWSSLGTAFGKLTNGAQELFSSEKTHSPEDYDGSTEYSVAHTVARYDHAIRTHSELRSNEFMERFGEGKVNPSYSSQVALISNISNSNGTAIIIIVSLIGMTAVGGYFFIRKRKEN